MRDDFKKESLGQGAEAKNEHARFAVDPLSPYFNIETRSMMIVVASVMVAIVVPVVHVRVRASLHAASPAKAFVADLPTETIGAGGSCE